MVGDTGVNEEFWQEVSARGPPNMRHSRDTIVAAYQALKPLSAQALYRGRPTMPVDDNDTDDNDDDIDVDFHDKVDVEVGVDTDDEL